MPIYTHTTGQNQKTFNNMQKTFTAKNFVMKKTAITHFMALVFLFPLVLSAQDKDPAQVFFESGERKRSERRYLEAADDYENASMISPYEAKYPFSIGLCYFMAKVPDKSAVYFNKALELKPNFPEAYEKLLIIYKSTKDEAKIIETFDRYSKAEPDPKKQIELKIEAIKFLENRKDFEKALSFANDALNVNPTDSEALYHHGLINNRLGNYKEAVTSLEKSLASIQSSKIEVLAPRYFQLGYAYHHTGEYAKKTEAFDKVRNVAPYNTQVAKFEPDYMISVGRAYMNIYFFKEAHDLLDQALKMDDNHRDGRLMKAELFEKEDDHHQIYHIKKAIEGMLMQKERNEPYNILELKKDYKDLMDVKLNSNLFDEAIALGKQCLEEVFPNLNDGSVNDVAFIQAMAYHKKGETATAIEKLVALTDSKSINPLEAVKFNFALGELYLLTKDFSKAKEVLQKARKGPYSSAAEYAYEKLTDEEAKEGQSVMLVDKQE